MRSFFIVFVAVIAIYYVIKVIKNLFGDDNKPFASYLFERGKIKFYFDDEAIIWCANFLSIEKEALEKVLSSDVSLKYKKFRMRKRRGGYRIISCPKKELMSIQKTIYNRILSPVNIHPAATGFRKGFSIIDNVKLHLGKDEIIKTDIVNFFGSIKREKVISTFERIGYPSNISIILAELCCIDGHLPQGAPTSPALSNIISYEMDKNLSSLSYKYGLSYTRYADDITFSGYRVNPKLILDDIKKAIHEEKFSIKREKTRYIGKNKRKLITGISISSGKKLTIPKAKKREIRKNVYFILTKGLEEHKRFIKSTDPVYLKRLISYLFFWKMVEPDNKYVTDSIVALKKMQ